MEYMLLSALLLPRNLKMAVLVFGSGHRRLWERTVCQYSGRIVVGLKYRTCRYCDRFLVEGRREYIPLLFLPQSSHYVLLMVVEAHV